MYVKVVPYGERHIGNFSFYECQRVSTQVVKDDEENSTGSIFFLDMENNGEHFSRRFAEKEMVEIYFMSDSGQTIDRIMWTNFSENPPIYPKES